MKLSLFDFLYLLTLAALASWVWAGAGEGVTQFLAAYGFISGLVCVGVIGRLRHILGPGWRVDPNNFSMMLHVAVILFVKVAYN